MANLSLREVAQSQLDQAPVIDGQLIVCTDTGSTYRDIGTRRIQISKDLEIVSSLPLAPLSNKIYYLRPDSLYVYSGDDWILLNPSKFTLESDKNAVNGEVNINLILNGTAQDKIKIAGGGVTTVTTGETGDITIDTPHPDELLAALTNDEIDAITGGMVDDSGNPLPTPQVVVDDEKKSWLDRAGAVHLWKTIEAMLGTKVDKIEGFGLSSNDYTTEEKKKLASLSDPNVATTENNGLMSSADKAKLDGIEAEANNYTHPVYEAKQAGLYRISVDNTGHVATADKMTSEELAAEGVSPVDHTHDLGELVDTLETSADAIEDADTVMVGATVTSGDGNATTKYTRRPLAALWDWIKSKTDTLYATVGHTHNYAGSTEPGGDALNAMKLNGYDVSMYGTANYWNAIPRIDDAGVMEIGEYLDFHSTDDRDMDYNVRMVAYDNGTLDVIKAAGQPATITANLRGTADYANNLIFQKDQGIDTSSLNVNTWYPVIYHLPWTTLCHIECWTGLGTSGKPSWATHSSGFYADLDMLATASGWGCTNAHTVKILDTCSWCDTSAGKPIGYSQVITDSLAVFWVRGGGYYHFRSSTAEN